ncbi:MAG: response regulator [Planctomycetota bacterium]
MMDSNEVETEPDAQSGIGYDSEGLTKLPDDRSPPPPHHGEVSRTARVICVGDPLTLPGDFQENEVIVADTSRSVVDQLSEELVSGVWVARDQLPELADLRGLTQSGVMLRDMPDGVALLDGESRVLWANRRLSHWCGGPIEAGTNFYDALGKPEIMGPDFCPFHTAMATGEESSSTLQTSDNRYFQVHAATLLQPGYERQLIASVSDVTDEIVQQQKLAAIHQAGRDLADLRPDEIHAMQVDDRISLLKDNIRHYLRDLLNFEVIEIRLLDQATGNLMPLLSVGIDDEASDRKLYAHPQGNGVTGHVASSGKSYVCQDVENDPLFLPGVADARSSITAPLSLHDVIMGTINVESPEPNAFSESDLQFLEIFARDVAFAINTLDLLRAQQADATIQSCDAIHSAVALPVDAILNDAVSVMEDEMDPSSEIAKRLTRILRNARDIKQSITEIGRKMTPIDASPVGGTSAHQQLLLGRRVLVVDEDEKVREAAHKLLEQFGCVVETAHDGDEAVKMVRRSGGDDSYDVIISDIRLPDYSGYQLMLRLEKLMGRVPMVLMTAFGYDPGHSIVKARQNGLPPGCVLFKPFRLDQLLEKIETALRASQQAAGAESA